MNLASNRRAKALTLAVFAASIMLAATGCENKEATTEAPKAQAPSANVPPEVSQSTQGSQMQGQQANQQAAAAAAAMQAAQKKSGGK